MYNPHYGFVNQVPLKGRYYLMNLNNSISFDKDKSMDEEMKDYMTFDIDLMMFVTNDIMYHISEI